MIKFYSFLSLLILTCSCQHIIDTDVKLGDSTELMKNWSLVDITFEVGEKPSIITSQNKLKSIGYKIGFFPDGQGYQMTLNGYYAFKWELGEDHKSILLYTNNEIDTLKFSGIEKENNNTILFLKLRQGGTLKLALEHEMLIDYNEDPYYPPHNKWRKIATKPESETALKKRVKNYLDHLVFIHDASIERQTNKTTFEYSPGIVYFFNCAISVKDEEDVPELWSALFFDKSQEMFAYNFYVEMMNKSTVKGNKTAGWLRVNRRLVNNISETISKEGI